MVNVNDDDQTHAAPPATATPEPSYAALFPRLDKVSPSSFSKGTLSRRRINIALIVLVVVAIIVTGLIVFADVLFGPR